MEILAYMRRYWLRLRALLAGRIQQRVTRAGLAFVAVTLLVGIAAFLSANNLLFLLLAAMLATLLVSGFVNRLLLSGLEVDLALPEHISARRAAQGRVLVRNLKYGVPSFSIFLRGAAESGFSGAIYFPVISPREICEEPVALLFGGRGLHKNNSFHFSSRFPFGFAERKEHVALKGDVLVYPCLESQPGFEDLLGDLQGELASLQPGPSGDFHRVRPYEMLESIRHLDWKATAHTGALQVREFARHREQTVELVLDLNAPPAHAAWFERAVDCCAYLASHLSERNVVVRLRSQGIDVTIPDDGGVYIMLKYLALVEPRPGGSDIVPDDREAIPVIFSAAPARMAEAGWRGARLLGPDTLGANASGTNDAPPN